MRTGFKDHQGTRVYATMGEAYSKGQISTSNLSPTHCNANNFVQDYVRPKILLVHDEYQACTEGDVVRVEPETSSKMKKHMVAEIISPVLTAEPRKPVETHEQWLARMKEKRAAKEERRVAAKPWLWENSLVLKELRPEKWLEAKEKSSRLKQTGV